VMLGSSINRPTSASGVSSLAAVRTSV